MKTKQTPPVKRRRGRPLKQHHYSNDEPLRWNLHSAAREFGVHREKLARRRQALGIIPGPDGCFSTADIFQMAFSTKEAEQTRLIAAQRRKIEMENERLESELVPVADVIAVTKQFSAGARKIICASPLKSQEKEEVCSILDEFAATDWSAEAKYTSRKKR